MEIADGNDPLKRRGPRCTERETGEQKSRRSDDSMDQNQPPKRAK
jgi:hypothetical protein